MCRIYRTPTQKFKMGLSTHDRCARCSASKADFSHLAWLCPQVHTYWCEVCAIISEIVSSQVSPDPLLCLLGFVKFHPDATRRLTAMLLVLARRRVSMCWGRRLAPKATLWVEDTSRCQTLLTEFWDLLPTKYRPHDIWGPLVSYLSRQPSTPPTPSAPGGYLDCHGYVKCQHTV